MIKDSFGVLVQGHIKIYDPDTNEIIVDKRNAINYETMSLALAQGMADSNLGFINQMAFGNGGTSVDPTGIISYLTPNTIGINATLYNQTYTKVVNQQSVLNLDPSNNNISILHVSGTNYTDLLVSCLLDYGEPSGQSAFDTSTYTNGQYVFDELGLVAASGNLLTHVIFHPVQKSLNRRIRIEYTVRIMSISGA